MRTCLVLFAVGIVACLALLEYFLASLDVGGKHRT